LWLEATLLFVKHVQTVSVLFVARSKRLQNHQA